MANTVVQTGGLLANNGVLQMRIYCATISQLAVNTLYFQYNKTAGTSMRLSEVAKAFADTIDQDLFAMLPLSVQFLGCKASLTGPGAKPVPGIVTNGTVGDIDDPLLPTQDCMLMLLRTLVAGPKGRGRIYLPFPPVSFAEGVGVPTAAAKTLAGTLMTSIRLFNTVVGTDATYGFTLGVYNRALNTTTQVDESLIASQFGTQRRRGGYGRTNAPAIT